MIKVGIVPNFSDRTFSLNSKYVDFVVGDGSRFVPRLLLDFRDINECDFILFPGGVDINPIVYGQSNLDSTGVNTKMDIYQLNLLSLALEDKKNIIGICRGMQLIYHGLNKMDADIFPGCSYKQNIFYHNQSSNDVDRDELFHVVHSVHGEIGEKFVNSLHHQAVVLNTPFNSRQFVDDLLDNHITYWTSVGADKNNTVVEGFQIEDLNIVAVQWHPEELTTLDEFLKEEW